MEFLILITVLLCFIPATSSSRLAGQYYPLTYPKLRLTQNSTTSYAVIFDGGSTGTRIHVFHFNQSLDLLNIGDDLELYAKITPGLSSYADDPEKAAESLVPLLDKAESVVPEESQSSTPVILGATAGLRELEGNAPELILEAVRNLLKNRGTFKVEDDAVSIIDGTQEGSYIWVTVNYLLKNLGKEYSETIGVADLGGGSVQMVYAVSKDSATNAPTVADDEDPYITEVYVNGSSYYLYAHSYLYYGKEASRAQIFNNSDSSGNPCLLAGYNGTYTYNEVDYEASASASGASFDECREVVLKVLNVNASCPNKNCTFNGIWNGGGGPGQQNLYLATSFYYAVTETGMIADSEASSAKILIVDYKNAAEKACGIEFKDANSTYPLLDEESLPYVCMDLVYQYTLLVDGFGLDPQLEVTVVNQIEYQGSLVDAAWPLGSAIEAVSSLSTFERFMYFV